MQLFFVWMNNFQNLDVFYKGCEPLYTYKFNLGFGDSVDNTNCWQPIIEYVDEQFNIFLEAETRVRRVTIPDNRVHVCLYFLAPSGHGLRSVDVEFMRRLHDKVDHLSSSAHALASKA